jgi:glycosyltransferase involved in cell wall biosynthesis/GT2 family glycosyltransferase
MVVRLEGEPVVACPDGPLADELRERGVRVFPLRRRRLELRATIRDRFEKPLRVAGHAREVRDLIGSLRPGVVVGWGTRAAIACTAAVQRVDDPPAVAFQNMDIVQGPLIGAIARAAARRSDLLIAPSGAVARDLDPHGAFEDRTVVVPPGVDVGAYAHIPPPDDPPRALYLGALVGWKRPRLALEAVALAARELPELELVVAGGALDPAGEALLDALRRRAREPDLADRVTFTGPLADPRPALAESTFLLHCADCEPYGMVVVEALAAGRPVIAPGACGPAEIVAPECGRLFVPGDPRSAADAMLNLAGTPGLAARVGAAGRERVESRYRVEDSTRRYEALFAELVERRRGTAVAVPDAPAPGSGMALVTVLHDSADEVRALLASVERHLPGAGVVAIDSGSSDDGAEAVRAWRDERVQVVELGENAGFGRACNEALALVDEPVTVLLNPDTELFDSSLAELAAEALRADRPERILAPVVVHPDGLRENSAHPEPGTPPELVRALVPASTLPRPLRARVEPWRDDRPRRVGWAVGACLVARTDTLRRLGPFDDRAFLYAEDLDLGLRATDAGVETWFWPAGRVLHRRAHATARAFGGEPFGLLASRRREVVRRWRGARRQRVDDAAQAVTFATRIALKSLLGASPARERKQLAALRRVRRERD